MHLPESQRRLLRGISECMHLLAKVSNHFIQRKGTCQSGNERAYESDYMLQVDVFKKPHGQFISTFLFKDCPEIKSHCTEKENSIGLFRTNISALYRNLQEKGTVT